MIYAIGDLHLEKLDWLPGNRRGTALMLACVRRVLKNAARANAEHVIFLGDVFDTPSPSQATLVDFLSVLSDFPQFTFHLLRGNHETVLTPEAGVKTAECAFEVYSWLATADTRIKLHVYTKPQEVSLGSLRLWFCPHPFVEDVPKSCRLGIGHFAWQNARTDNGHINKNGSSPKGEWVLGDYHTHQSGDRFVYAGSLTQTNFGEGKEKAYLTISYSGLVKVMPSPVTFHLEKYSVRRRKDYQTLVERNSEASTPEVFFSVVFENGFVPPATWQSDLPWVVRHTFDRRRAEGSKSASTISLSLGDGQSMLTDGLTAFLKARGVEERARARGIKIVQNIVQKIGVADV